MNDDRVLHILFDGNNTAYRANCTTELYTKMGERTSAILGTLNITHSTIMQLSKLLGIPVKEVIYAWDMGHSERRKTIYPEYKSNRKKDKTEDDKVWLSEFINQANILYENLPLFGLKCFRKQGWEGDDLISCLSKAITKKSQKAQVVIVSTDEDFHQLIGDRVMVYSPIKQILFTRENYRSLTDIPQELFLSYKILKGDSSDGIDGISGIGEKTAKILVNSYGNLRDILSHKEDLMKSKRTARIFTAESLAILDRNDKLINLDFVDSTPIQDEVDELLEEIPVLDSRIAKDFLKRYQLSSILIKWDSWSRLLSEVADNFNLY